uniref:Uncharacterized protein n=1 Tax=Physcomitrium patens TaxID=3218 RepID=A0A2K1IHL1_PHYPA|nr:hypothetical protein PHYPA_029351 [Physcomitrium patens]
MQVIDIRVGVGCLALAPSPMLICDFFMSHFCNTALSLTYHHSSRVHLCYLVGGH